MPVFFAYLLATLVACEVLRRSRIVSRAGEIVRYCLASGRVISSDNISDHWKEKALTQYALRNLVATLQLMLSIFLITIPFLLVGFILDRNLEGLTSLIVDPTWLVSATVLAAIYLLGAQKLLVRKH